jgi:succinoglycan biosynthesis protein ExoA
MSESSASLPMVSVLLPVRNEGTFIERSLGSVLAQDYPGDRMEVIVADGDSQDDTARWVARLGETRPNLHLIRNPERIVATGLNRAFVQARGEVIVRVDGHCEIATDYVRRCVEHIRSGADGVGGSVETVGETPIARVIAAAMSSKFGVGDSAFRTVKGRSIQADTVPFPAYTRSIVEKAGPYDTEFVRNQDDEYNYRLRKMGARLLLAADVKSVYYSRTSLGSLWRQYRQYGYWKVRVLQKHPRQMSARQFVPPLFVGTLIATAAASPFSVWARVLLASAAGAYMLANVAATIAVVRRQRISHPVALSAAFAAMHLGYGLGFLTGLIRFCARWGDQGGQPRTAPVPNASDEELVRP